MAAVVNNSQSSDEDWLVFRSRSCLKTDPYAAKAWLITARTLFPRNFLIQFEAYGIEKNSKNIKEAARLLEEMFAVFPNEAKLWSEVHSLSEALQSDSSDARTQFHRDLFSAIPSDVQCHMLLRITDTTTDVLDQCRLLLLALKRFPELVPQHGMKLVETLLTTEKHAHLHTPVNCYRKYAIHDVLPVILRNTEVDFSHKQLYRFLQKSVEFYISYVTQPPSQETHTVPSTPDLLSPTKKLSLSYSGGSLKRQVSIQGLSEKDERVSRPWESLFEIIQLVNNSFGWQLGDLFNITSRESQWQRISSMYESLVGSSDYSQNHKQILYCGTILFLHCLYTYASKVDSEQFASTASGATTIPLVLIEAFKSGDEEAIYEPKTKKLKKDNNSTPTIHAGSLIPESTVIIENFVTALKCWELLHATDFLEKDLNKLLQHWKADSWQWMKMFDIDMLIHKGHFKEAISKLQKSQAAASGSLKLRSDLQLACCHYCLGNFSSTCEMVLSVVHSIPQSCEPQQYPVLPNYTGSGRHLQLLGCSDQEVLPYCIQLLLTCFKEKAFATKHGDDMALGHMLVLIQYDWPKQEPLFTKTVDKIKQRGAFTYNIFFNYIVNIDILEEFAYVKTPDAGKVNLDILPTSTKVIAQQRTVTRGVNKGVKEDFKLAMEKQVSRTEENIESVIRSFLTEERDLIQHTLR